jgi:methylmalonyl-CoA/ethylmalonyl-CoA epimerase
MTATTERMITGIGQVAVPVKDVEAAVEFYRDVLELPLLMRIPNAAFVQCGDVRIMLALPESPEFDHPASIIYYRVADIHEAHRTLSGRGVAFVREPHLLARMPDHELWMAFFEDPSGNTLALMSEVR